MLSQFQMEQFSDVHFFDKTEFISKFKDEPLGHWENEYGDVVSEEQHQMNLENDGEFDDIWVPDSTTSPQYPIDRELKICII